MQEISYFLDHVQSEKEGESLLKQAKIERLKLVRQQELELSKRFVKENLKKTEEIKKEEIEQAKFQEYLKKLDLINKLNELKSQNIKEIGNAHKSAQIADEENIRKKQEEHEKTQQFEKLTKQRGKQAKEQLLKEQNEKNEAREELLRIKREVINQEALLAHEKAKEYRELMKNEKPKEIPEEEFFKIKNDKNLSKMKKRLDYKNTHFHNPVIQRHDLEAQKENAMDNANMQRERTEAQLKEKNEKKMKEREKSKERGEKALKKNINIVKMKNFENDIEKLSIMENTQKIQQDVKEDIPVINKTMQHKQTQQRQESELEEAFLTKFSKKPPKLTSKSPNPKDFLKKSSKSTLFLKKSQRSHATSVSNSINRDPSAPNINLYSPLRESSNNNQKHEKSSESPIFSDMKPKFYNNFIEKSEENGSSPKEKPLDLSKSNNDYIENANNSSYNENKQEKTYKTKEETAINNNENIGKSDINDKKNGFSNEFIEKPVEKDEHFDKTEDLQEYIKEQEEYLEKLEHDRKKLKRRLIEKDDEKDPFDFIEQLHMKENTLNNDNETMEFSKSKAHDLMNKFLGDNDHHSEEKVKREEIGCMDYSGGEGLIVKNMKKTPNKIEGGYLKTKENTPFSDLSYSVSMEPSPDKNLRRSYNDNNNNNSISIDEKKSPMYERKYINGSYLDNKTSPSEVYNKIISKTYDNIANNDSNKSNEYRSIDNKLIKTFDNELNNVINDNKPYKANIDNDKRDNTYNKIYDIPVEGDNNEGLSLAEIFKRKKGGLLKKLEENKKDKHEEGGKNDEFKERTKEEILKLRKEMMKKPNFLKKKEEINKQVEIIAEENIVKDDEPNELMRRLAMGIKQKVGKKEMKALTSKNYEKLPEVKKKKELEEKKNEFKKRQENAKKLEQRLRENLLKKP